MATSIMPNRDGAAGAVAAAKSAAHPPGSDARLTHIATGGHPELDARLDRHRADINDLLGRADEHADVLSDHADHINDHAARLSKLEGHDSDDGDADDAPAAGDGHDGDA